MSGVSRYIGGCGAHVVLAAPPRSVSSWTDLVSKFSVQFATSRMYRKTSACLDDFKQDKQESLKDYLDQFCC